MLSKNNKILIGCLALLLVMSVGYALFSDTITINGSATAKGDFSITTEAIDLNNYSNFVVYGVSSGIVENPTISVVDNKVTTSVTLDAPGSHQYFGIKVKNTGSIPATLSSIKDITNNYIIMDKTIESGISVSANTWDYDNGDLSAEMLADDSWIFDYDSNDMPVEDRGMSQAIERDMLDAVLDPGEEVYFVFHYMWNPNSEEKAEDIETLIWEIEINWEQITN